MKRCIVCGARGDKDSEICEVCGNPFVEIEDESDSGEQDAVSIEENTEDSLFQKKESAEEAEIRQVRKPARSISPDLEQENDRSENVRTELEKLVRTQAAAHPGSASVQQKTAVNSSVAGRPRMRRSTPQIYGQAGTDTYDGAQGVIRREVRSGRNMPDRMSAAGSQERTGLQGGQQRPVQSAQGMQQRPVQDPQAQRPQRSAGAQQYGDRQVGAQRPVQSAQGMQQRPVQDPQAQRPQRSAGAQQYGDRQVSAQRPAQGAQGMQQRPVQDPSQVQRPQRSAGAQQYAKPQGNNQADARQHYAVSRQSGQNSAGYGISAITGKAGGEKQIRDAARGMLTSPLFLLVALFQTVYFISSIAAIFMRQLNYSQILRLISVADLPAQINSYMKIMQNLLNTLDSGALGMNLAIRVPDLLFCIGLWLVFLLAHASENKMSGAGFLFMKVVVIIGMIKSCVVMLALLILSVTLVIASWSAGAHNMLIIAAVTLVLVILATLAVVAYYFSYLSTITICKLNACMGERTGSVSVYVALIQIVLGLTGIINILSGIVNLEITGITGGAGKLVWMLLFGIWIIIYRSSMKENVE